MHSFWRWKLTDRPSDTASPLNFQVKALTSLHVTYGFPQNSYSKGVNEMCSVLVLPFYWLHVCLGRGKKKYSRHEEKKKN